MVCRRAGKSLTMKKKLLSLEELKKSWWWNRDEICRNGVPGIDWPKAEIAARNYELARRSINGKKLPLTYLELGREGKTLAARLWVNWLKHPYRVVSNREQFKEIGWTPVNNEYQHRQWNLRLPDKKLMDEFIREIKNLREIQKIPAPRRNEGEKHRGVSWKMIEILDRKQNRIDKLDDTERHQASVAQKLAKKYFKEYERALNEFLAGINTDSDVDLERAYTSAEDELENPYT